MTRFTRFTIDSHSPEETQNIGAIIGELALPGDIVLLTGNLGAGKTCLTQGIAHGLGIMDVAASPSFMLVRQMVGRIPLYHMDLYRMDNLAEIADLGLDEYFYGKGLSVVEWADRAIELLPPERLLIDIISIDDMNRVLCFEANGSRYQELLQQLKCRMCHRK